MTSKYLNKTIQGWKVVNSINAKGGHKTFVLAKKTLLKTKTMTVRDNTLTLLATNKKTIEQLIRGKEDCVRRNYRVLQNTIRVV